MKNLPIGKYVSIWATGKSVNLVSEQEKQFAKDNTFTIALNYCDCIEPHARIWIDWGVSSWVNAKYMSKPDDCILISRKKAFPKGSVIPIEKHVHNWIDEDEVDTNYTFIALYKIIKKYFPETIVIMYGVDCVENTSLKREGYREGTIHQQNHIDNVILFFKQEKNNHPEYNKWFNTNLQSGVDAVEKKTIYEVIHG